MHWGVKKHGKGDWSAPPKEIIPKGSEQATDIAWETPLEAADSIQMQGDTLQLQKAVIRIPAGLDLTGLTFVCKSKDGTMWWRDGKAHAPRCSFEHLFSSSGVFLFGVIVLLTGFSPQFFSSSGKQQWPAVVGVTAQE